MADSIYAGIGSRSTPDDVLRRMKHIASRLRYRGWVLRTGGASGADTAFLVGHADSRTAVIGRDVALKLTNLELYLPWQGFAGLESKFYSVSEAAIELAVSVSPHIKWQNRAAKLLHGRNAYQVLGYDLRTPAKMIVCWTPRCRVVGGTATALKIAALPEYHIPVYNLAFLPNDEWLDRLQPDGYCSV